MGKRVWLDVDWTRDLKLQQLMREWGSHEALYFWPVLRTFVREHGGRDGRIKVEKSGEFSEESIAKNLYTRPEVMVKRLSRLGELGMISWSCWDDERVIFIPKLLEHLHKRSAVSPPPAGKEREQVFAGSPLSPSLSINTEEFLIEGEGKGVQGEGVRGPPVAIELQPGLPGVPAAPPPAPAVPKPHPKILFDLYNEERGALPAARDFTDGRQRHCVALLRRHEKRLPEFLEDLKATIQRARESEFCLGTNDRHWRADFDFLLNESNMTKVLEGKFDNHGNGTKGPTSGHKAFRGDRFSRDSKYGAQLDFGPGEDDNGDDNNGTV